MAQTDSIDTNFIVHYLIGDSPKQYKVTDKLLSSPGAQHFISDLAISECVYVLEKIYRMSRETIADLMFFFLTRYSGVVICNNELISIAMPLYLAHPKLSWNDCALAAEAEVRHHEPLFTFDKKLVQQLPQAKLLD